MSDATPHEPDHDRLRRMVVLEAPAATVWAAIGGFDRIAEWHPLIATDEPSEIEGDRYRYLHTTEDERFLERLIEEGPHHYTYEVVESPLPVSDWRATLSCVAEGEGRCHVFWSAHFVPAGGPEHISDEIVAKYYEIGLEALRERFSG